MCARRSQRSSTAGERVEPPDVDEIVGDPSVEDEAAMRLLRKKLSWEDWLLRDFLRYWYWLAAMIIDVFVPWGAADFFGLWEGFRAIVVFVVVIALLAGEVRLYFFLWPEGPWGGGLRWRRWRRFAKGPGIIDKLLGRNEE